MIKNHLFLYTIFAIILGIIGISLENMLNTHGIEALTLTQDTILLITFGVCSLIYGRVVHCAFTEFDDVDLGVPYIVIDGLCFIASAIHVIVYASWICYRLIK